MISQPDHSFLWQDRKEKKPEKRERRIEWEQRHTKLPQESSSVVMTHETRDDFSKGGNMIEFTTYSPASRQCCIEVKAGTVELNHCREKVIVVGGP